MLHTKKLIQGLLTFQESSIILSRSTYLHPFSRRDLFCYRLYISYSKQTTSTHLIRVLLLFVGEDLTRFFMIYYQQYDCFFYKVSSRKDKKNDLIKKTLVRLFITRNHREIIFYLHVIQIYSKSSFMQRFDFSIHVAVEGIV